MKTAEAPPPQHSGGPGGSSSTGYFYWSSSARCSVLANSEPEPPRIKSTVKRKLHAASQVREGMY
ncbi:hypothetical protein F2Q68_00011310 [Brassica cretica]|uniref:Uncharacterized protein n=1 Tax=Brassica cretica TaxID=69181 RepID=A0A8S9QGD3_BRACR|nr:hypothetical protein F2Q68_00011310 [Brassica cretica]KAF3541689.1 hypothetical protein F2Q69_00024278 [Brassica cretica]